MFKSSEKFTLRYNLVKNNALPQKAALADWKKVKVWMMMIATSLI